MGITSLYYLLFFAIVFVIYYILPLKLRWVALLIGSLTYILIADNAYLVIYPVITIAVTWVCALGIGKIREKDDTKDKAWSERRCRFLLVTGLVVNIGFLAVLKYFDVGTIKLIAPTGISFYTMSVMAYLLDVYYGLGKVEKNYFKLLLFGTFFPLLISGPIIRYKDTGLSLCEGHRFDYKKLTYGAQRVLWGLFKVLVISERLAVISDTIFDDYSAYPGIYVIIAAVCFTLRLYTNFSGSMDIALGMALTLGIELPENFKRPFFSQTVQEFWQRWHITLGEWLRDYVLYSILRSKAFAALGQKLKEKFGKKKGKNLTTYIAMMILWLIAGIWHGGSLNFIWGVGLLQGIYIIIGEILKNRSKKSENKVTYRLLVNLRRLRTFCLMSFALLFFRAKDLKTGFVMIAKLFAKWNPEVLYDGSILNLGLDIKDIVILAASLMILFAVSILQEKESICERLSRFNIIVRWGVLFVGIFAVIIFGSYGPGYDAAEFIYQGF